MLLIQNLNGRTVYQRLRPIWRGIVSLLYLKKSPNRMIPKKRLHYGSTQSCALQGRSDGRNRRTSWEAAVGIFQGTRRETLSRRATG